MEMLLSATSHDARKFDPGLAHFVSIDLYTLLSWEVYEVETCCMTVVFFNGAPYRADGLLCSRAETGGLHGFACCTKGTTVRNILEACPGSIIDQFRA